VRAWLILSLFRGYASLLLMPCAQPLTTDPPMATEAPAPPRHIRLTSHPGQGATGAPAIRWGSADPLERGPLVGTTTNRSQRNVVGTHSGS
jgi:hypothetical protein